MYRTLTWSKKRVISIMGLWAASAWACPVPVYQYALEHWPSDPCEVRVYSRHPLAAQQQAALDILRHASRQSGPGGANLTVRMHDGNSAPAADDDTLPRIAAYYPPQSRIRVPFWSGELTPDNARALLASPLRERLGEALLRRTSAVWIFLESGDTRTDRAVERLLKRELERLEKTIVVPDSALWGGEEVQIDDHVNFEVMRLSREDPAERMLVRMLLLSEPDLETEFEGQPMVFPVYGRGLILYALVGPGINARTIETAARFLTGPCSCQIKAANPGTDLLMSVDWSASIEPMTPAAVGVTAGTGSFLRRLDEADAAEGGEGEGEDRLPP